MVACDDVRHPRRFSGLDLLTVLTIDLDKGLFNVDRDAIMAGAQTVYASTTGLYVASQRYVRGARGRPRDPAAQPHRHPPLRHLQARRDELRVVGQRRGLRAQPVLACRSSTARCAWPRPRSPSGSTAGTDGESESFVTVLAEHGRSLDLLGRVGGPGPRRAHLRRALRRRQGLRRDVPPGRSALHARPLQEDRSARRRRAEDPRLLGLPAPDLRRPAARRRPGRHRAGPHARHAAVAVRRLQPARCRRARRNVSLGGGASSSAEFDPHAFLFWKPANLAVIPLSTYGEQRRASRARSASGSARRASPRRAGSRTRPSPASTYTPPIGRSLVIGDALYTLSYAGLAANRLDNLASLSFTAFPRPPRPSRRPSRRRCRSPCRSPAWRRPARQARPSAR